MYFIGIALFIKQLRYTYVPCLQIDMTQIPEGINKYNLSYITGAISSLFEDWVKNGMEDSPKEKANYLAELTGGK